MKRFWSSLKFWVTDSLRSGGRGVRPPDPQDHGVRRIPRPGRAAPHSKKKRP